MVFPGACGPTRQIAGPAAAQRAGKKDEAMCTAAHGQERRCHLHTHTHWVGAETTVPFAIP
eukprot:288160-Chlamydomonas_euryale.AAC.4